MYNISVHLVRIAHVFMEIRFSKNFCMFFVYSIESFQSNLTLKYLFLFQHSYLYETSFSAMKVLKTKTIFDRIHGRKFKKSMTIQLQFKISCPSIGLNVELLLKFKHFNVISFITSYNKLFCIIFFIVMYIFLILNE